MFDLLATHVGNVKNTVGAARDTYNLIRENRFAHSLNIYLQIQTGSKERGSTTEDYSNALQVSSELHLTRITFRNYDMKS